LEKNANIPQESLIEYTPAALHLEDAFLLPPYNGSWGGVSER
jgi:hypothetical protein